MSLFLIHITKGTDDHHLVSFEVPLEHLEGAKTYDETVERAGWWYMNKIDFMSCTGDYRWTVFPISVMHKYVQAEVTAFREGMAEYKSKYKW